MLQDELSTDMDRLTQLQDAIEALLTITTSSLSYLTRKTAFRRLNSDVPVTFRSTEAESSEAVFEDSKRELVQDLTRKAKQVEYLIRSLPDKDDPYQQAARLEGLEREMKLANTEYVDAVRVAEALLADIKSTMRALLDGDSSGSDAGEAGLEFSSKQAASDVRQRRSLDERDGLVGTESAVNDHLDKEKDDVTHQGLAVIGIAVIAMGEEIGAEMSLRQFNHLMYFGDPVIHKAVPLALGLISASNPQLTILDTLSKYSHDNDLEVALNAIFAMGMVGAGTNNARLAQMLRQLAGYYAKEPDCLFMVRIAQGLVHMGKGTIGINPFHSDRSLMSKTAVAGLLATLMAFTEAKEFIFDKSHWMIYSLVSAMHPRFFITLDDPVA